MPTRAPMPCRYPQCRELVAGGGYCDAHKQHARGNYDATTRKQDEGLRAAADFRNSAAWRRVSRMFRASHPVCCDPFREGCTEATAVCNHIESLQLRPDLALHWSNLAPNCTRCDARVGAMERRGEDAAKLFVGWRDRYAINLLQK